MQLPVLEETDRCLICRHSTADSNHVAASSRPGGQPNGPPSRPIVMKGRVLKTMLRVQPRPRDRTRSMVFANLEAKEGVQKVRALKLPGPLALSWSIRYVPRTSYRTFSRNLTVAPQVRFGHLRFGLSALWLLEFNFGL